MLRRSRLGIFLFVPNLIGYFRLLLIGISWAYIDECRLFLPIYIFSVILDGLDGWAARKLNQISDYGACLDVVIDLIGRGMVWCYISKYGYAVIAFEWIVFIGNNERAKGAQWKESFMQAPYLARLVMDKGFKTPLGTLTILGLHCLPPWLYAMKVGVLIFLPAKICDFVFFVLLVGRILCGYVELWCAWKYLQLLLSKPPYSGDC